MKTILVSVVMPVYNAVQYIDEAIQSILNQSFSNFELIVIDDGSIDGTVERVQEYDDSRIKLYRRHHDFIGSLNFGLQIARGKYIARMDADDVMHVDRLRIQYNIMELEPTIDCCSSWVTIYDEETGCKRLSSSISGKMNDTLLLLLRGNPFYHSTMMLRKEFLEKNQLRYEDYKYAEDYKLWVDMAKCGGIFYIESQSLLCYRVHKKQVTNLKRKEQERTSNLIKEEIIGYLLLFFPSDFNLFYERLLDMGNRGFLTHKMKYEFMISLFTYNNAMWKQMYCDEEEIR